MRISKFAKKYQTTQSTIRHYVKRALLTPDRENGQYVFNERCDQQMERIMALKSCHFSLDEIFLILSYETLSELKDADSINMIVAIVEKQRQHIQGEIKELDSVLLKLSQMIDDYESLKSNIPNSSQGYLPLEFLKIFRCPRCGSDLRLTDACIEGTGISQGQLECECGYSATVRDGIIVCRDPLEETPFKTFNFDEVLPTFTNDYSPQFRTLLNKCQLDVYHRVSGKILTDKFVMAGPLSNLCLMTHLKNMPNDAYYIIVEPSVKRILKYRSLFADYNKKILYIMGDIAYAPIADGSIDVYIDDFSSSNFTTTYNQNLMGIVGPKMKRDGYIAGLYLDYSKSPKTLKALKDLHPNMDISLKSMQTVKNFFDQGGLIVKKKINCGAPEGNHHFYGYVEGETFFVILYEAVLSENC